MRASRSFDAHRLIAVVLTALFATPTPAIDAMMLELGFNEGKEDVERYGGAVRWNFGGNWHRIGDWQLDSYLELSISYWDGTRGTTGETDLVDFGLTPVFRYQRTATESGLSPYVEMGLGVHGHTETGIGDREFDIPFAFGTHFGAGARFGEGGRYELGYRFQHLSNAGLGDDNPGINFHVIQLGYHF